MTLAAACPADSVRTCPGVRIRNISWREECWSLKVPRITPELARLTVRIFKKDIRRSLENRLSDFLFCVMQDIL